MRVSRTRRAPALLLVGILALGSFALAGCSVWGSRGTWEPDNDNVARYGSWTDEAMLLSSTLAAVSMIVQDHPPWRNKAVSIRVPRDPDSYSAAALLADALESGGSPVSWIAADDGVAAPSSGTVEIWEVACTIRGAVTEPAPELPDTPPFNRSALVEVRVCSLLRDGSLLWSAQGQGRAERRVNLYFADRKVVPGAR